MGGAGGGGGGGAAGTLEVDVGGGGPLDRAAGEGTTGGTGRDGA